MRETNSVCKDDNGFIWTSSKTGILRLTDDNFRVYQLPYESANIITVKLEYKASILLAYTNNGQIFVFNQILDKFEFLINLSTELSSNFLSINSILISGEELNLWISTSTGLYNFYNKQLSLVSLEQTNISGLIWLDEEVIIYSNSRGFWQLNINSLEQKNIYPSDQYILRVSKLFLDKEKERLWIGTISDGLFYINLMNDSLYKYNLEQSPKQPILAIESISDSTLLIGFDGQGLWEINKEKNLLLNVYKENIDNTKSLRGNGVYDIFCDKNERVWVSTYSGGLSYFDQASPIVNQLKHYTNNDNSLVNNDVNCVIEDQLGNLWIATNNGISRWHISTNKWRNFYTNNQDQAQVFLTLCEDDYGRIWAGSYSSGVYVLDIETGKQLAHYSQFEEDSPFVNDFVFDIFKDSIGNIWIGGINSQVICYISKNNTFKKYSVQPINVLTELSKEQMLFGCTYGLSLSDNETGNIVPLVDGCLIHDILVQDSIIWLGTSGDGLIKYNYQSSTQEKFTIENGLPSNFVNSVAFSDGYIWLGTETGLCRFDPKDKTSLIYSSINALSSVSYNRNSHYKLKNGNLAWGTNNGIVIFNPKTIKQDHSNGKIFLQDISIMGRSIRDLNFNLNKPLDELDKITIKHNQNNIAFELLPIGIASGSKFSWKLEGLDKDWVQPTNQSIVSYTNIPSKEYILKLRLYDNSLSSIVAERSFIVDVTPPFWATYWFLIIVFLLVSSVIYFSFWYYINTLKQKHTEEKVKFFTNTAHDLRTSLTLIKAPIEELSKEKNISITGRNFINLANEQALRLSSVVTQLMDFQKIDIGKGQISLTMCDVVKFTQNRILMFESLASKREITIKFESSQPECHTVIDESMIEKVIDNLISNAIKYSFQDSVIEVFLKCNEIDWSLVVNDKGIGMSKPAQKHLFKEFYRGENAINSKIVGSGIGLLLVKKYVALHEGEVIFSSEENVGSSFQISIPKKQFEKNSSLASVKSGIQKPEISIDNEIQVANKPRKKVALKEMKILIVEDNDDLLHFMEASLSDDFEVSVADDGEKAWDIIQKQLPDLIVTDVMMPNKDGFELCQQIKTTFETSHIPVVLLTALSGKAEQLHGLGLGADDYLTKPFDMALLRQKIKTIIQNREYVRNKALKLIRGSNNDTVLNNELNDKFVKKMLLIVRENIDNSSFNKDEFAAAMNVSSSLLYKKVKSLTDQSPTDFIKYVRMNYALELIQSNKYNVTEVSEMCGFSSIGYFSTVFKKHFGITPTDV